MRVDSHEERVNAATHALGLAGGMVAAVVLVRAAAQQGGPWQLWGCSIYAVTLVAAFAASALSHLFSSPRLRLAFRAADQAVIFLFIAASYTPIALTWMRGGPWWWVLHALVWAVALGGFISKAVFSHNVQLGTVSPFLYLLLGWMPIPVAWLLLRDFPVGLVVWLFAGGLCYTLGTVFFRLDHRVRYFHAAWHVMVLAGSASHYAGILLYCTAEPA